LIAHLQKTALSEKMIEDDLSRVEESATKSTYKMVVGFERCEDKDERSASKFVRSSNYHKEEESFKPNKINYTSNPKSSFNPKREVRQETSKPREEAFVCIFYGRVGHLDEFYFRCKRIKKRHLDYARNSYRDEFIDFLPRSHSRALPCTSSHALPQFAHESNHRSYGFSSRENRFKPRRFGYGPHPHHGDYFLRRHVFPAGGSHTHFEPRHLDGPCFFRRGSRPTRSSDVVRGILKTSSGCMVKCWIPKIYLTNPSTKSSTSSRPM
jgi:hypothetical protein